MHVLYIHQHFATPEDSLGTRSYEFSQRLIAAGHKVTMICGNTAKAGTQSQESSRIIRESIDNISVIRITEPYANAMGFTSRVKSFVKFSLTATFQAREIKADLVFASSTPLTVGIPGILSASKHNIPFVFEVRDLWPELPVEMGVISNPIFIHLLRRLEHYTYKHSTAIVALAPGMKKGIVKTGYPEDSVHIIPNGADIDLFRPTDSRDLSTDFGDDINLRIVYCGHHGLANNLQSTIECARILKRRKVKNVLFVMIGGGGEKDALIRQCNNEGLDDYYSWHSSMPKRKLAQTLPKMDIGLMSLLNVKAFEYGTSPNKFFDYLAAGLPVLNNYPGWVKDLIEENKCGIAVEPENPESMADAIQAIAVNPNLLSQMGKNARKLAEKEFSRDVLGSQFIQLLNDIYQNDEKY